MQLKTPCPKCGKRARYTPDEIGLPAICHACGERFTFPPEQVKLDTQNTADAEPEDLVGPLSKPWVWVAIIGGLGIGLAVGVAVAVLIVRGGSSDLTPGTTPESVPVPEVSTVPPAPMAPPPSVPIQQTNTHSTPPDDTASIAPTPSVPPSITLARLNGSTESGTGASSLSHRTAPARPTSPAQRPAIAPIPDDPQVLTDDQIANAITRGVNYLESRLDNRTHELKPDRTLFQELGGATADKGAFFGGLDALYVYALLQCGQAIDDPKIGIKSLYMTALIDQLKKLPDQTGPVTYARSIRTTALALYNRPEDRPAIKLDLQWLLKAANNGAYSYDKPNAELDHLGGYGRPWDNSNSQYGLLGVWSAAEAAQEVPGSYWSAVENHWTQCQLKDGEWGYEPGENDGRLSMTCAGVASLFVTHDALVQPHFASAVGRDPFSPALVRGLDWLEKGDRVVGVFQNDWVGYSLYGIERAGLASGFKYFGAHDWYRELATQAIATQNQDGSWGDRDPSDTPYILLFLARGRHPILMNKLRFDGYWANRPRDLANLSQYVSREMEQPVNWQVVPLTHPWTDWTDCPILYLASHQPPQLSDDDCDNIRHYIESGGLLFTQADGDSTEFNKFIPQLAHRLFPAYQMQDLPASSPLYSVLFHEILKPKLQVLSNGSRLLMIHSPFDLSRAWQFRELAVQKMPFEFGLNMFLYASGKHALRNRLETNVIPAPHFQPTITLNVARLRYAGNWDPEPYAWTRFTNWFERKTGYGLNVQAVDMSSLSLQSAPIAVLTGTAPNVFTAGEINAVQKFVQAGGVLFIDNTGGTGAFEESVRTTLLAKAFPDEPLQPVPLSNPLLNAGPSGMVDLRHSRLRPYALDKIRTDTGEYPSLFLFGKGHVIFTPLDMTSGLLGTNTWGILGYEPEYSQAFVSNTLLWTVDGQKDEP